VFRRAGVVGAGAGDQVQPGEARIQEIQTAVAERVPPLRSSVGTGASDMADLPGGASGMLVRGYKGKEADRLVTRIGPGGCDGRRPAAATSGRPPRRCAGGRRTTRSAR
jgi:hypothetical protein